MNRILVIRGGAIGDFVLTLPAMKLLREAFPHARLEILGYRHIAALAENRFYAQATRSIEYGPLAGFFAKGGELNEELARYFDSFDAVVSYLFDPDRIFEHNLARCGVDVFVAGSPKMNGSEHAAIQLAHPLKHLGLGSVDHAARLFPSDDDRAFASSFFANASSASVAIHPGSGSPAKNWPIDRWRSIVATLSGRELLLVGGEADEQPLAALQAHNIRSAVNLPLPQLAAVLERCELFVGHDSGISHIAAAVGARCVLLFGATNPDVWAPANPGVEVIRAATANLNDISVEQVLDAIAAAPARS